METGHPSTRAVNSGSGNRALAASEKDMLNVLENVADKIYLTLEHSAVVSKIVDICTAFHSRHGTNNRPKTPQ